MHTYRVVSFSGYTIGPTGQTAGKQPMRTDWHVVDEKGRTVAVYAPPRDAGPVSFRTLDARLREQAEKHAERLNAASARPRPPQLFLAPPPWRPVGPASGADERSAR